MKKLFFFIFIFCLISSCNDNNSSSGIFEIFNGKRILKKELEKDGGLYYYEGKPFNGIAFAMYDDKNIEFEQCFKDGKFDGEQKYWYRNGQLEQINSYENGVKDGKLTSWYDNGQLIAEGFYKDNYETGSFNRWYDNGNKMQVLEYKVITINASNSNQYDKNAGLSVTPSSGTFNLSIMIGKHNEWYENGQIKSEGFYNEKGNLEGFYTTWNDDGSVNEKKLYKDGDLIN
jgi:antitoxin component YwqK of YwqJK toxin-antitoxin module